MAHQLVSAPLKLYDANIFYPFQLPFAYSETSIANGILGAPIVWLTDNPILALNSLLLLSFVVSGFGVYLLVVDLTDSVASGMIAGLIFAFSPYRVDRLVHIAYISTEWLPLVFYSLRRLLIAPTIRWAIGYGVFLTLAFLSSFLYAYMLILEIGGYLVAFVAWRPRLLLNRRAIGLFLAPTVVASALLVAAALPSLEVARLYGFERAISEAEYWSARPINYLAVTAINRTWLHVA